MDFPTRNLYRSAIEELARGSRPSELEIARAALAAARRRGAANPEPDDDGRKRDPGLSPDRRRAARVRSERSAFARRCGSWPGRFGARLGIGGYVGGVVAVAAIVLALPLARAGRSGDRRLVARRCSRCSALIPAIDAAIALVNRGVTDRFGATILPGLELRDGVPAHLRTLVAVPILLDDAGGARRADRAAGGPPPREPGRRASLRAALGLDRRRDRDRRRRRGAARRRRRGHRAAERRYGPAAGGDRFLLLHRRRVWNDGAAAVDRAGSASAASCTN